jgi:AcrR family transcriptional regulator
MADTRQRILDTAQELFTEVGYESASLRAIAEQIGITKAALYYYFPSKEALLDALISPTFEFLRSVMPELAATTDVDEWTRLIGDVIDFLVANQGLYQLVRRNVGAIHELAQASDSFAQHDDVHQAFDDMAANRDIPLDKRIRLMAAIGVATSLVEQGEAFLAESPEQVRQILRAMVAAVLHAEVPAPIPAS